ncbi:bifunctional salicylyl-CoA 5-hydroxylase/oxidoreductase [Variovorax sp. PCZ-1]|uniref:bifunctional salicylyl-CoA 5-hydroxylase/oxidoreductase n=1 Tax=Variovorax sp. PCZ-1 TaxID=2835533 RepID=UPI001BCFD08D|nr:bifunctional salicylyl-CoA 5-hydroxylase/oxidoreductase [Variovorax sp. PCZ-1]MBS7809080.1 bifunctional salicylyl-CoA 5-hydroxylase/oxidoreductase [Variovorax sp. PCZ-1]
MSENNPLSSQLTILCIGGGPSGLYFALLMKKRFPAMRVIVAERNRPFDTFGWGVVLSDQTLGNLKTADPESAQLIGDAFNHWDDIEVFFKGRSMRSTGHGFCGIGRKHLLNILQERCQALGVELVFETDVQDDQALAAQYGADLVIASDGLNSRIRTRYAATYQPDIDTRRCRFVWLGTKKTFDAFTFAFEKTEHGWFAAHAYKFNEDTSTFIVETPHEVWKAHGLDAMEQPEAIAFCEKLFAKYLDGNALMSNASHLRGSAIWIQFPRVVCGNWVHEETVAGKNVPIVLMGDAAHTAHFSIGSGTKLALEDAIDLADEFVLYGKTANRPQEISANSYAFDSESISKILQAYQARRSVEVLKIQNAARNSTEWFENVERYAGMEVEQFYYSLLTRSQRISHDNLRVRDAKWLLGYESWFGKRPNAKHPVLPMLTPFKMREVQLKNRIVVSPMATYSAVDGILQDFHLVHLGARALGGAALVMVEMTSPTMDGRITPACPVLENDAQQAALARIAQFFKASSGAKLGLQLGHSGPKGSTQLGWETTDEPLTTGNWPLIAASAVPYGEQNQIPKAMTRADMDRITAAFVESTRRAQAAGIDWLELHCAHGYLLSSFICPLTNKRSDEYGGSLENRCRYPLEVFKAIRAAWPQGKPISVRISAHDWAEGGNTDADAVEIARLFQAAGADMIDVSSGQTTRAAKPIYGRMYQTPFADRIRNEIGIATIAVGAITEADHANSIIAAGRADLCAIARPHLADPAWTLHAAAQQQSRDVEWPLPYISGRDQMYREIAKARAIQEALDATH